MADKIGVDIIRLDIPNSKGLMIIGIDAIMKDTKRILGFTATTGG